MPSMTVNGDLLHYDDVPGPDGAPVLVWGHGFLLSAASYAALVGLLPQYRHVFPDLRGHGRSAGAASDASTSRMADDVWAIVEGLGIDRFAWVGHSMGNAVGVRLAARHPSAVTAGVSLAGIPVTGKLEEARSGVAGMVDIAGDADALTAALAGLFVHADPDSPVVGSAGRQAALVPRTAVAGIVLREFFLDESQELLPRLTQPWLFLVPGADSAEPAPYQVSQAALLPDATVVLLDGEGHMVPQERPALTAEHIGAFLASLAA